MKKILYILLIMMIAVVMTLFSGCGDNNDCSSSGKDSNIKYKEIGSWEKTKKKAEADKKKHTVEFRINKVETRPDKVAKEIEKYNSSAKGDLIETDSENDKTGYIIAYYDVKFPKDFPDSDFGITDVAIKFKITSMDGKEELTAGNTVYKGLSEAKEIGDMPVGYDFYSGQTYKGKILYLMVKDYTDYCIKGGGYYFKAPENK